MALYILWSGVLEQNVGVEYLSGVEWSFGVEWSQILKKWATLPSIQTKPGHNLETVPRT